MKLRAKRAHNGLWSI